MFIIICKNIVWNKYISKFSITRTYLDTTLYNLNFASHIPGSILLMGQIWDKDGYCVGTRFPSILGTILEFKNLGQYWDLRLGQHSIQSCPNVLYSWVNAVPRTK